jgi:hypothetical protein
MEELCFNLAQELDIFSLLLRIYVCVCEGFLMCVCFWLYVYCTLTEVFLNLTEVFLTLTEVFP